MFSKVFVLLLAYGLVKVCVAQQSSHPLFRQHKSQASGTTGQQKPQLIQPQQQPPQQFIGQQQPQFVNPQQQFGFVPQQPPQQFFDPNQQFQPVGPQQFVPQPQPQQQFFAQAPPQRPVPQGPQINWGKCPQLEPSEKEKMAKATVITKCLETTPLPANITRETVELHREQIAACALQSEGWFNKDGGYDFAKAESEIKNKKLTKEIEEQVLGYHKQCKSEAEEKFPGLKKHVIAQIQLYQACMDYFISDVCGIEVNEPESVGPQFAGPFQ